MHKEADIQHTKDVGNGRRAPYFLGLSYNNIAKVYFFVSLLKDCGLRSCARSLTFIFFNDNS